jgi:hypothetical protein
MPRINRSNRATPTDASEIIDREYQRIRAREERRVRDAQLRAAYEQRVRSEQTVANNSDWYSSSESAIVSSEQMNASFQQIVDSLGTITGVHAVRSSEPAESPIPLESITLDNQPISASPFVYTPVAPRDIGSTIRYASNPTAFRAAYFGSWDGEHGLDKTIMVDATFDDKYLQFKEMVRTLGVENMHLGKEFSWGKFSEMKPSVQIKLMEELLQCSSCRNKHTNILNRERGDDKKKEVINL